MTMPPPHRGVGPGRTPAGGPLPVAQTVRQAYALLAQHRDDLLRLAALPVFVSLIIDVMAFRALSDATPESVPAPAEGAPATLVTLDPAWFLLLLGVVPTTLFAVNWLRVLLMGPATVSGTGTRWGRRETQFLLLGTAIMLITILAVAIPLGILTTLLGGSAALLPLAFGAMVLGFLYILLRSSFALVAAATEHACSLAESWVATKGESGRFLLITVLTALPFELAALVLPVVLGAVGLSRAAPLSSLLLNVVLSYLVSAAALTAIALVYRRLRGPQPPRAVLLT